MVRGCLTVRSQQIGAQEPEKDPQEEDQPDATESKNIAEYNLDVDYVGSEPKVEKVAQDKREIDPDKKYAKMEIPSDGTLSQRMIPWEKYTRILWVHKVQGPEIIA